ncbi:MAG: hypothetical protein ACOYZ8_14855 [Chloroflexota bacterium]
MFNFDNKTYRKIFGEAWRTIPILQIVAKSLLKYQYSFLTPNELGKLFQTRNPASRRAYWIELLKQIHLTSSTSVFRTLKWLDSMTGSYENQNYLGFGASFRGFLEASADSVYTLNGIAKTLAKNRQKIFPLLNLDPSARFVIIKDLEDLLNHYAFARGSATVKQEEIDFGVEFPNAHRAKTTRTYLDSIGSPRVHDCYTTLCEITHPAMRSVWSFVSVKDSLGTLFELSNQLDKKLISKLCQDYQDVLERLLQISANIPIMTFRVLNSYSVREISTPIANKINLKNVLAWNDIDKYLNQ